MSRSKSSHRWLREHFSDPFVKKAQAEGMRSRAAYKLEELLERDRLLKPGMTVVDLGAAPGGWSQFVRQAMGDSGRVVALDILAGVEGIGFMRFTEKDVVRHPLVQSIIRAYESFERATGRAARPGPPPKPSAESE